MASIEENLRHWSDPDAWRSRGDNWSEPWGNPVAMWFSTILPRIGRHLPADHLLEIACGHGRVTSFLLDQCRSYTGVDLVPSCVESCQRRFAGRRHARFCAGDGRSLAMVADGSVDFAVSWDSLVHVDRSVMAGYVAELARVLRPDSSAFLHHSNLAVYVDAAGRLTVDNEGHWRDPTTSADIVHGLCIDHGLHCVSQELVQWGLPHHGDCFTVLRRPRAGEVVDFAAPPRRFENPYLREEIGYSRMLDRVYHPQQDRGDEAAAGA